MTEKQRRFVEEYMRTGNARQAYYRAGYKAKNNAIADANASRLIGNDKVQEYIHEISEQIKDEKIADIEEMQVKLTDIIRGMTTEEVIVSEMIGNGMSVSKVIEKKPSIKDVIKACELLGKLTGAFTSANTNINVLPVFVGEDELED